MTATIESVKRMLANRDVVVYRHSSGVRHRRFKFINQVKKERELLLSHVEAEQLIDAAVATKSVPGEIAEVGVFRGASARLLREYRDPSKILHLFDTFCGLPEPESFERKELAKGQFYSDLAGVQQYLGHDGIQYHVGMFPESVTDEIRRTQFSFVHLDVDLYRGTLECLRFFYPRMTVGGIILSHDFGADRTPGVQQAFSEYFRRFSHAGSAIKWLSMPCRESTINSLSLKTS